MQHYNIFVGIHFHEGGILIMATHVTKAAINAARVIMASGMESELEAIDETQVEGSGSCDTSTTSGMRRKRNKTKCGGIFRRLKTRMAAIVSSVQNVAKLLRQK